MATAGVKGLTILCTWAAYVKLIVKKNLTSLHITTQSVVG